MQCLGYSRAGDCHGRPLVLLHGWGCDSQFLKPIAHMFPERDVFLLDLPGYGNSYHLAPYATSISKIVGLLINTIPDGADILTWSCGTLYLLSALRFMQSPEITSFRYFELEGRPYHSPACMLDKSAHADIFQLASFGKTQCVARLEIDRLTNFVDLDISKLLHKNYEQIFAKPFAQPNKLTSLMQETAYRAQTANQPCPNCKDSSNTYKKGPQSTSLSRAQSTSIAGGPAHSYALRFPKIRSLITVCGSPRFPSDPNWIGINPDKVHQLNRGLHSRHLKFILKKFYRMQAQFNPALEANLDKFLDLQDLVDPNVLKIGLQQITAMDERPALRHLQVPSLHLFGAKDLLVSATHAKYCFNNELHSSYVFKNSAHAPFLTEPEEFERQLRLFFTKVERLSVSLPQ